MVTSVRDTFSAEEQTWALATFGQSDWGDRRLTKRLVDRAARWVRQIGRSMAACCSGNAAAQAGSYRFLGNDALDPEAIARGGFKATVGQIDKSQQLLALEDTTKVSYRHAVADELGLTGSDPAANSRGFLVHFYHADRARYGIDAGLGRPAALAARSERARQKASVQAARLYRQGELQMAARLGEQTMKQVISVCDQESDVYEYLHYKSKNKQRFVVRARADRLIQGRCFQRSRQPPCLGCKSVSVPQRGGRKARIARVELRAMPLVLCAPRSSAGCSEKSLLVNAVLAQEVNPPAGVEPLKWRLLTSQAQRGFSGYSTPGAR